MTRSRSRQKPDSILKPKPVGKMMKKILLSTAMLVGMAAVGYAQDVSISFEGTQSTTVGTSFSDIGSSSTGTSKIEGQGAGVVTVTNSLSAITLAPVANASSEYITGEASTEGTINVVNDRSVYVNGTMAGLGQITGMGSTTTTFDASLLSNAKSTTALSLPIGDADQSLEGSYEVSGLANLSGVSGTSAGFQLTGTSSDFLGAAGTTVLGGFDATAYYYENANTFDFESDGSVGNDTLLADDYSVWIDITETNIDLPVANLGGGTVLLTGANADLFSGATLSTTNSDVTLNLSGEFACSVLDGLLGDGDTLLGGCAP